MSPILSEPVGNAVVREESAHAKEAARIGGVLMTTGTALLVCLALFVCAFLELLPWHVAVEGSAGIATLLTLFYLMARTGLNRRFSDPSLATEQTAAAIDSFYGGIGLGRFHLPLTIYQRPLTASSGRG